MKSTVQNISLLSSRGLGGSPQEMSELLNAVGWFRLYGYFKRHRVQNVKEIRFLAGTTIRDIKEDLLLDRRLRLLLMDALERIEVGLRAAVTAEWSTATGSESPQGHINHYDDLFDKNGARRNPVEELKSCFFKNLKETRDKRIINECNKRGLDCRHDDTAAFQLPLDQLCELCHFGDLVHLLDMLKPSVKARIAPHFGIPGTETAFFISLVKLLRIVRNHAAHHSVVWDKAWTYYAPGKGYLPMLTSPQQTSTLQMVWDATAGTWVEANTAEQKQLWEQFKTTTAYLLTMCRYMVSALDSASRWEKRVEQELKRHPDPKVYPLIGFSATWAQQPQWY